MENSSLLPVEKAEQYKVAIKKVESGPDVQRQAEIESFQPEHALIRSTEKRRFRFPFYERAPALCFFLGKGFGVAQMLLQVEENVIFLAVIFHDRSREFSNFALHVHACV